MTEIQEDTEILDDFDFNHRTGPRQSKYPWATWFDGKPRKMVKGKNFHIPVENFRTLIYVNARERGLSVQTRILNEDTIVVRCRGEKELGVAASKK